MARVEKQIAQAAAAGRELLVDVRPVYAGRGAVPSRIIITVRQTGGRPSLKRYDRRFELKVKPRPKRACR